MPDDSFILLPRTLHTPYPLFQVGSSLYLLYMEIAGSLGTRVQTDHVQGCPVVGEAGAVFPTRPRWGTCGEERGVSNGFETGALFGGA